jgi:hypothetical protein
VHDAAPDTTVAVHRVVDPEVNVTVPVAPDGSPVADSDTAVPYAVDAGFADALRV